MGRRTWVKLYASIVYGSTPKELDPAERWVWIGLLVLAGDSQWDGVIKATVTLGYSDDQISDLLNIDVPTWRSAKRKMIKAEKITIDDHGIISIVNWEKYQSEYDRQKKYREKGYKIKLQDDVTGTSYSPSNYSGGSLSWIGIEDKDLESWMKAYPACDIKRELLAMIEWVKSNPEKGLKKNYRQFITGWLSRSQAKGGGMRSNPIDYKKREQEEHRRKELEGLAEMDRKIKAGEV
jgi:hypothetical protein